MHKGGGGVITGFYSMYQVPISTWEVSDDDVRVIMTDKINGVILFKIYSQFEKLSWSMKI